MPQLPLVLHDWMNWSEVQKLHHRRIWTQTAEPRLLIFIPHDILQRFLFLISTKEFPHITYYEYTPAAALSFQCDPKQGKFHMVLGFWVQV